MTLEEKLKQLQEKIKQNLLTSVTILIMVLLLLLIVIPYLDVSHRGINNATVEATLENQSRATLAQILGGVAIGIGLYYTWRRITIAEEDLKATKEGQITERFTRAVDQLGAIDQFGNPAIEIRLGGIYALERIANESEKDYWPIMKILTAYVRKNSSIKDQKVKEQNEVLEDIQAILTVIGKRNQISLEESRTLNLKNTFLRKADLEKAHLEGADLTDSILTEANLKKTHLEGAYLSNVCFYHAILSGADLKKTHIEGASFERAVLEEVDLSGVDAHLGANFSGANLERSNLKKIKLWGADLSGANLKEVHLEGANLEDSDLKKAKLQGTYLEVALLSRADLTDANFEGTNLREAYLREADLRGAKNLTVDQLSKVKTLYKAELDPQLEEELRSKGYSHLLDDEP